MDIKTKFAIGDRVWTIHKNSRGWNLLTDKQIVEGIIVSQTRKVIDVVYITTNCYRINQYDCYATRAAAKEACKMRNEAISSDH